MTTTQHTVSRAVTLKDVARHARVSVSTASRALSGHRNVQDDLASRVREAALALNYRPNVAARGLRLAKTMTFGAIFNRLESPVALEVLDGLGRVSHDRGYSLLVANAAGDDDEFRRLVRRFYERRVDALFIYRPAGIEDSLKPFHDAGVPVIALFARGPGSGELPLVSNQPGDAIDAAVQRLADLGHTSVAYLATPIEMRDGRTTWLEMACRSLGIRFAMHPLLDDRDHSSMRPLIRDVMQAPERPTALFARYRHLPALIEALRHEGMRLPEDASLVSFGDAEWLSLFTPPIAAITTDGVALGSCAVDLVLRWLEGEHPPATVEATPAVWIDRGSVAPAPRPAIAG